MMKTRKHHLFALSGLSLLVCAAVLCLSCSGGGSSSSAPPDPPAATPLTVSDVMNVVQNAVTSVNAPMIVAVVDRAGTILAVFQTPGAPMMSMNFGKMVRSDDLAVGLARTAAFFSNDQAPLSSRTVRFISGIHFPPGVMFAGPADLYGIENTNRGCLLTAPLLPGVNLPRARSIDGLSPGLGIQTGRADLFDSNPFAVNPGGVPLFKNGHVAGGIGVVGPSGPISEYAAAVAALSPPFAINPAPPGVVIVGGLALPFVNQKTPPEGPGAADG